jgi:hypothetical protein
LLIKENNKNIKITLKFKNWNKDDKIYFWGLGIGPNPHFKRIKLIPKKNKSKKYF